MMIRYFFIDLTLGGIISHNYIAATSLFFFLFFSSSLYHVDIHEVDTNQEENEFDCFSSFFSMKIVALPICDFFFIGNYQETSIVNTLSDRLRSNRSAQVIIVSDN